MAASPVPYEGAPTQAPSLRPTPELAISTPPAAFGADIAQGISQLGQVQERAGEELFNRAYAMRELQAHANANAALANTQNKQLQAGTDYRKLEGKAAVDALPDLNSNLDAIRDSGRQNLSPYEQQLYDGESRSSTFREKFSAAGYASSEQKRYLIGASKASSEAAINATEADPTNSATFEASIAKIRTEANHQADLGGLPIDDPQRKLMVQTDVARAYERRIYGLAETGHIKDAQDLFNKATAEHDLVSTGTDAFGRTSTQRVQAFINEKRNSVGARHGASEVMSGKDVDYWLGRTLSDSDILNGLRSSEGGSYGFTGPEVTDKSGHRGRALGHYGVMTYSLEGFLREAGMAPMTPDQFLHDPDAQDKLAVATFRRYIDKYGNAGAVKAWFGGEGSAKLAFEQLHDANMDGTRYIQNFVSGLAHGTSLATKVQAGKDWAAANDFDEDGTDRVVANIETLHNNDVRIRNDTVFNNDQTIWGTILNGVGPAGNIPTTPEEVKLNPQAAQAWDWLAQNEPTKLKPILNQLMQNARGDVAPTPERVARLNQLSGLSIRDPQEFMKQTEDLSKLDLPLTAKNRIIGWRRDIERKQISSPNVNHALDVLGPQLNDVFGPKPIQDRDNYDLFTGAMRDIMRQFQEDNQRPMSDDEIETTGARLLRRVGAGWLSSGTPQFEVAPSSDWLAKARALPRWRELGVDPTDAMLREMYIYQQYQKHYGKNKAPTNAPAADTGD